jgi:uncharacterized protein (DUF4415 family)
MYKSPILKAAAIPLVADSAKENYPETTPAGLAEFAAKARELRRRMTRTKPAVTIRVTPDCLEKYQSLGKGYTGIMADVLSYVANNPEILSKVH